MAHRLARQVVSELDEIWSYLARESGSAEIADRFIDSLTDRFFLLSRIPACRSTALRLAPWIAELSGRPICDFLSHCEDENVLILHVVHSHGDIETILNQQKVVRWQLISGMGIRVFTDEARTR